MMDQPPQLTGNDSLRARAAKTPPAQIGLVFALGIEDGGLVDMMRDGTTLQGARYVEHIGRIADRRVAIIESGVGRAAAAQATDDLIALHKPEWVVSAGFCGGLRSELKKHQFLMANAIADESGRQFAVDFHIDDRARAAFPNLHVGKLVTVDALVLEPAAKQALGEKTGALACDMESFAVAEVCQQTKTRFLSVRIVSDAVDEPLPPELHSLLQQKTLMTQVGATLDAIWNRWSAAGDIMNLHTDAVAASDKLARFLKGILPQLVPQHG